MKNTHKKKNEMTKSIRMLAIFLVPVAALFFGISAAGAELVGGALLVIGWLFRTSCLFLLFTMFVATATKIAAGGGLPDFGYPLALAIVVFAMIFTGPGQHSIQKT